MAEYLANATQVVALDNPLVFNSSIPCTKGYVYHEDETGNFTLRGITPNCFARYRVTFNGNIAIPEGGTAGVPIAVGITVNGEVRQTSIATVTPAAVQEYNNVTSTTTITVPRGCCFNVAVRAVVPEVDTTITPAPTIELRNVNLVITRIA